MAGGLGTRLRPLTYAIPKPLIPIGDKPILEILLGQLARSGLSQATLCTGYKGELIRSYFGDGSRLGVPIRYVHEPEPLGTAGALRLIEEAFTEPFLLINGDILTRLDFASFFSEHVRQGSELTAAVSEYRVRIPYGVVEENGSRILGVIEKPSETRSVLAGIYAVSPSALSCLPRAGRADMPDWIRALIAEGRHVRRHALDAFWMDVGGMEDFETALKAVQSWGDV